jgi:hypothetical protein
MKTTVFWDIAPCSLTGADVSDMCTASIIRAIIDAITTLMKDRVHTSETSFYSSETVWHYIPEDSHLHVTKTFNSAL